MAKEYIGDGVFADFVEGGMLLVTTEDGHVVQNKIYFEIETWAALMSYVARYKAEQKRERKDSSG